MVQNLAWIFFFKTYFINLGFFSEHYDDARSEMKKEIVYKFSAIICARVKRFSRILSRSFLFIMEVCLFAVTSF